MFLIKRSIKKIDNNMVADYINKLRDEN